MSGSFWILDMGLGFTLESLIERCSILHYARKQAAAMVSTITSLQAISRHVLVPHPKPMTSRPEFELRKDVGYDLGLGAFDELGRQRFRVFSEVPGTYCQPLHIAAWFLPCPAMYSALPALWLRRKKMRSGMSLGLNPEGIGLGGLAALIVRRGVGTKEGTTFC